LRVRAALLAAWRRDAAPRCREVLLACRDKAAFDAARFPSRFKALLEARERLLEGFLRRWRWREVRPSFSSRVACSLSEAFSGDGSGQLHSRPPGFGKSDSDGLLLPPVLHFDSEEKCKLIR